MINDVEEVLSFNQAIPRRDRVKHCIKKPIKGLCFKEMLLKVNNSNREGGNKSDNQREHKNNSEEAKVDCSGAEDTTELNYIDKFC